MINITKDDLYPLLFEPAYKQVFWGGEKFRSVLKRPLPEDLPPLGEAWDICDRYNIISPYYQFFNLLEKDYLVLILDIVDIKY